MFGASALYHRPTWQPKARVFFRRLDHAAIFLLIAGKYGWVLKQQYWAQCSRMCLAAGAGTLHAKPCPVACGEHAAQPSGPAAGTNTPLALIALPVEQVCFTVCLLVARKCWLLAAAANSLEPGWRQHGNAQPLPLAQSPAIQPLISFPSPVPTQSTRLLSIVWGGALAGIAQCMFFSHAPKALAASL